ncbi:uncharacterized protein LOC141652120 [Silene latifolia]|uniref:uncharacterized protein LOC141652120 n=1 Tax=Silene latifolia TaxID=37657 RepID=UPI003D777A84
MITYFQRYDYRGKSCPMAFHLFKDWDLKTLSKRLKDELDVGPLGRLTLSKVMYPRCQNKTPDEKDTGNTMLAIAGVPKAPLASPTPLLISTSGTSPDKKFIQIELPPGVEDDDELKARAVDGVHELYLKIQRNAVAFYSWYTDAAEMLKKLTTGATSSTDLVPSQATQAFFEGAKVKEYVEEVGNLASQMKKYNDNAPSLSDVGKVAKKKRKASKKRKTKAPKFEFTPTVEPVSLAEDSDLHDKAGDAAMSEVMETADFYNTAELNEACRREEEECGLDLTDNLTQYTDRQILEKIYSPDEVEEAYTKSSLNEEQESLGGEVPDTSGGPEKTEDVVQKCKSEATNKGDADVVGQSTEDGSSSVQLKFISTADIDNALQGLADVGDGGGEAAEGRVRDR